MLSISSWIYISLSILSLFASKSFFGEGFENLVILLTILFPIKSPVASAVFGIGLFETVLSASAEDCLA